MNKLVVLEIQGARVEDSFLLETAKGMNYGDLKVERRAADPVLLTDGTALRERLEKVLDDEVVQAVALTFPPLTGDKVHDGLLALSTAMNTWDVSGNRPAMSAVRNIQDGYALWGCTDVSAEPAKEEVE